MFGADIEFFLYNDAARRVEPVFGKVGGTKDKPIKIDDNFSYLEDNACIEFNYKPQEVAGDLMNLIGRTPELILKLTGMSAYGYPEAKFPNLGKFKQAEEFGCVPDYDAYATDPEVPRDQMPDARALGSHRCAGGHIHLSYDTKDKIPPWVVAQFMDVYITIPMLVAAERDFGKDAAIKLLGVQRRKFYGLPGLHRPKEYGIEYRTLSNYFATSATYRRWLEGLLNVFSNKLNRLDELEEIYMGIDWKDVRQALVDLDWKKLIDIDHNRR